MPDPTKPSFREQIMNLPCDASKANEEYNNRRSAYAFGNNHGIMAAAEIAVKADAEVERLREALAPIAQHITINYPDVFEASSEAIGGTFAVCLTVKECRVVLLATAPQPGSVEG